MPEHAYRCEVLISPRQDILDPQGDAVQKALSHLGFSQVDQVKVGRYLTLQLSAGDPAQAEASLRQMCETLLANPITEDFVCKVTAL